MLRGYPKPSAVVRSSWQVCCAKRCLKLETFRCTTSLKILNLEATLILMNEFLLKTVFHVPCIKSSHKDVEMKVNKVEFEAL